MSIITITAPAKPATSQPAVEQENVSAALAVAVPAAGVFSVLADPAARAAIDGTGWVQESVDRAPLTEVGQIFRMGLVPLGPSETEVRLAYDWSAVPQFIRERGIQFTPFGPDHLTNSLHHLAELAAPTTGGQAPGGRP